MFYHDWAGQSLGSNIKHIMRLCPASVHNLRTRTGVLLSYCKPFCFLVDFYIFERFDKRLQPNIRREACKYQFKKSYHVNVSRKQGNYIARICTRCRNVMCVLVATQKVNKPNRTQFFHVLHIILHVILDGF